MYAPWKKTYEKPKQCTKKQRHYFADKVYMLTFHIQRYGFSSSHIWSENWTIKKAEHRITDDFELWCLGRLLRVPRIARRLNLNPKGNQPWVFTGKTDAEAEAPIYWPPYSKSQLIGKDPDVGKDWGQEEKGTTEDEMVGWHHQLNGHESEQTLGDCEGLEAWSAVVHGVTKNQTRLRD